MNEQFELIAPKTPETILLNILLQYVPLKFSSIMFQLILFYAPKVILLHWRDPTPLHVNMTIKLANDNQIQTYSVSAPKS